MRLNQKLNLVIPVEQGDQTLYVHSTPISTAVFERYFLVLSKTFSAIYNEGLGVTVGPRVAALLLRKIASDRGELEDVEKGLLAEVRRLSNVVAPGEGGWTTYPFQEAVDRRTLDDDDIRVLENALVYFTVASSIHTRADLLVVLDEAGKLWSARTTSLNCTEYAASCPKLTVTDSSGETVTTSSVPS